MSGHQNIGNIENHSKHSLNPKSIISETKFVQGILHLIENLSKYKL